MEMELELENNDLNHCTVDALNDINDSPLNGVHRRRLVSSPAEEIANQFSSLGRKRVLQLRWPLLMMDDSSRSTWSGFFLASHVW